MKSPGKGLESEPHLERLLSRFAQIDARPESEMKSRVASLRAGPWTREAGLAWKTIGHKPLKVPAGPASLGDLTKGVAPQRQRKLLALLKPHWVTDVGAENAEIRASFDEALTYFQLCELALEAGYLTKDALGDGIRHDLARLLWSEGSRRYVQDYDYIAVGLLAKRYDLDIGYRDLNIPETRANDEGRFAQFLSQHLEWYEPVVSAWLEFLDDYRTLDEKESDKDIVYRFLGSKKKNFEQEADIAALVIGADRFLTLLTDLRGSLSKDVAPCYGLFYLYWMARMFGWDSHAGGFLPDPNQVNWGNAIAQSKRLAKLFPRWEQYAPTLAAHVVTVEAFWLETLNWVNLLKIHKSK